MFYLVVQASQIAKKAHKDGTTLVEAGGPEGLGYFTEAEFERWVVPAEMVGPTPRLPRLQSGSGE